VSGIREITIFGRTPLFVFVHFLSLAVSTQGQLPQRTSVCRAFFQLFSLVFSLSAAMNLNCHKLLPFLLLLSTTMAKIPDESAPNTVSEPTTMNGEVLEATMEERKVDDSACFHVDVNKFCFNRTGENPTCECEPYRDSIVCCNVTDLAKSIACLEPTNFRNIHVINLTQGEINVTSLNSLKQVDSLVITDGNVSKVVGQFSRFSSIKCLNFSNNNITEINERALLNLSQLKTLDLSGNNITKLPTIQNITVNIEGKVIGLL
jgi:Leucine-rich repeat (LRR) protein